jgi:hypothetical protein
MVLPGGLHYSPHDTLYKLLKYPYNMTANFPRANKPKETRRTHDFIIKLRKSYITSTLFYLLEVTTPRPHSRKEDLGSTFQRECKIILERAILESDNIPPHKHILLSGTLYCLIQFLFLHVAIIVILLLL